MMVSVCAANNLPWLYFGHLGILFYQNFALKNTATLLEPCNSYQASQAHRFMLQTFLCFLVFYEQ
jgi:hypothetical protein